MYGKMSKNQAKDMVTIGLIQMSPSKDTKANLNKALKKIDEAAKLGADIICLPELFRSLYFCQEHEINNYELAEDIPGETTEALSNAANKNKVVIIAGIFEKRAPGLYHNSAAIINADGSLVGIYRKMHIPNDPHFFEKYYFTPGDTGFKAHATEFGRIGVLICWDQWYPEAARLTALHGANILFYPTAIGWLPNDEATKEMQDAWEMIQRGHGIANGVFVAVVNRVGTEGKIKFWGSSFVSGPFGEMLSKAGSENEEILIAKCDLSKIGNTRKEWPFLRDRRIDAYKDISSRMLE